MCWLKEVDVKAVLEQRVQESDLTPQGKERLKEIMCKAAVVRFKNDCGRLGPEYAHEIVGGVH